MKVLYEVIYNDRTKKKQDKMEYEIMMELHRWSLHSKLHTSDNIIVIFFHVVERREIVMHYK